LRVAGDAAVARTFRFLVVGFGVPEAKPSSASEGDCKLRANSGALYISLSKGTETLRR
jgi:hypothetical protein